MPSTLEKSEGGLTMKYVKIPRQNISRIYYKDLDPYTVHGSDKILPDVFKECA